MNRSILIPFVLLLSGCGILSLPPLDGTVAAVTPKNVNLEVLANQGWQDSTIPLQPGQRFRIDYVSGTWTYWDGVIAPFDAAGDDYICTSESCCEPAPRDRKGGLLGKLGDEVFFIGNGGTFTARTSGILQLRMNDCDTALADNTGSVTIKLTPLPLLSITDVRIVEGTGTTPTYAVFKVKLAAPSARTVRVHYTTLDGTATAPVDYTARSGTLTYDPGQVGKSIWIAVNADAQHEANEIFRLRLSNAVNSTIADARGVATIIDDDTSTAPSGGTSESRS